MTVDRMRFELHYQFPDENLVSKSELRFLTKDEIEKRLLASGLTVQQVLGDWDGKPFDQASSREMIFMVGKSENGT